MAVLTMSLQISWKFNHQLWGLVQDYCSMTLERDYKKNEPVTKEQEWGQGYFCLKGWVRPSRRWHSCWDLNKESLRRWGDQQATQRAPKASEGRVCSLSRKHKASTADTSEHDCKTRDDVVLEHIVRSLDLPFGRLSGSHCLGYGHASDYPSPVFFSSVVLHKYFEQPYAFGYLLMADESRWLDSSFALLPSF